MGFLKLSPGLFLGQLELNRLTSFLSALGYNRFIGAKTKRYGLLNRGMLSQGPDAQNGDKTISIVSPIVALNASGNYTYIESQVITPPQNGNWYWIKAVQSFSSQEQGTFSIDTSGNLTATGGESLLTLLRGQPDFPTKIKFIGSTNNTLTYDVLRVIDATHAVVQGTFQAETGLKLKIVGTFLPNIVAPEADWYPFQFDSVTLTFVPETLFNTAPEAGEILWLARVRVSGSTVAIQLKQQQTWKPYESLNDKISFNIDTIAGIDSIKWPDANSVAGGNQVQLSWGVVSSSWQVSGPNKIVLQQASGGLIKTVANLTSNQLNGFKLYTETGYCFKINTSTVVGSTVELILDYLDYAAFSSDGGLTFTAQNLRIVPDADSVEFKFIGNLDTQLNRQFIYSFANHLANSSVEVPLVDLPKTMYRVLYRLIKQDTHTEWRYLASDTNGYMNEFSFDAAGSPKSGAVQYTPYTTDVTKGFIALVPFPSSWISLKNELMKNLDGVASLSFLENQQIIHLYPTVSKSTQLITSEASLSSLYSTIYVNLNTSKAVDGTKFVFQLGGLVSIGDRILNIVTGYVSSGSTGTLIKSLTKRDFFAAKNLSGGGRITCTFNGVSWVVSQDYNVGGKGEITQWHGTETEFNECFDSSGLGKVQGWFGHAICNGNNGTPNLEDRFILAATDTEKMNQSGGNKTLTLSNKNIPAHAHSFAIQSKKVGVNSTGGGEDALWQSFDWDDPEKPTADMYNKKTSSVGVAENIEPISLMPSYYSLIFVKRIY